ncbi:hypothetical protein EJ110_NYTH42346 [Nymphaea thermarum]|nr:hypothetical protein EJ110_NYTH42346 [Nymphaea thermarum]
MAGNSFSYGTMIKLNGSNYEIWSRVFIMSVAGHMKKYILEEDEPIEKKRIYAAWDEDNYIVMSWIMNSVESHIAPTIAYYTKAKDMWSFLRKTYSHATNVIKILQLEGELCNIRQGEQDLSQYFATLTAAYERLKALRPPCQHCYASHVETGMVAKFLSGLSSEYSVAKSQILTGSELSDLAYTYNRLSRFAATLTQNTLDTPVSALVILGGRGPSSFGGTRGRGIGRGAGRGRFQCSYCGKIGHLKDRCWDKHPHLRSNVFSGRGGGRIATSKDIDAEYAPLIQSHPFILFPSQFLSLETKHQIATPPQRSCPVSLFLPTFLPPLPKQTSENRHRQLVIRRRSLSATAASQQMRTSKQPPLERSRGEEGERSIQCNHCVFFIMIWFGSSSDPEPDPNIPPLTNVPLLCRHTGTSTRANLACRGDIATWYGQRTHQK